MTIGTYILRGHEPVPEPDLITWANWFGDVDNRRVAQTQVGRRMVSTVFLGVEHGTCDGQPLLFETMTFPDQKIQDRCCTWEQAEELHAAVVARLRVEAEVVEPVAEAARKLLAPVKGSPIERWPVTITATVTPPPEDEA
jgi:hypothetical protein